MNRFIFFLIVAAAYLCAALLFRDGHWLAASVLAGLAMIVTIGRRPIR